MSVTRLGLPLGLALFIGGMLSPIFSIAEARFGDPNWEVTFFGQFSATLALPMLGIGVLAFVAARDGHRGLLVLLAVLCGALSAGAAAGAAIVGLNVPLVLTAARNARSVEQAMGLKIVTAKALLLCALYGVGGLLLALKMVISAIRAKRPI